MLLLLAGARLGGGDAVRRGWRDEVGRDKGKHGGNRRGDFGRQRLGGRHVGVDDENENDGDGARCASCGYLSNRDIAGAFCGHVDSPDG